MLDTEPLVAALDRGDPYHDACVLWHDIADRCITTEAVVTEATHLVIVADAVHLNTSLSTERAS